MERASAVRVQKTPPHQALGPSCAAAAGGKRANGLSALSHVRRVGVAGSRVVARHAVPAGILHAGPCAASPRPRAHPHVPFPPAPPRTSRCNACLRDPGLLALQAARDLPAAGRPWRRPGAHRPAARGPAAQAGPRRPAVSRGRPLRRGVRRVDRLLQDAHAGARGPRAGDRLPDGGRADRPGRHRQRPLPGRCRGAGDLAGVRDPVRRAGAAVAGGGAAAAAAAPHHEPRNRQQAGRDAAAGQLPGRGARGGLPAGPGAAAGSTRATRGRRWCCACRGARWAASWA